MNVFILNDHQSATSYEPPAFNSLLDSASSSIFLSSIFSPQRYVLIALKHLDTKKSAAPDGIPALFLQKVAEELSYPADIYM